MCYTCIVWRVVNMRKVYVIQMDTKTIPARIISLFTMYKYSHVAISFDRNCDVTYSFGRKSLYSIFSGGFVMESKSGKFFKRFRDTNCRVYEVEVTNRQYRDLVRIIRYMKKNKNIYGYDYLGIILRYLRISVVFKNKYVCSYFVAELLEEANVCNFNKSTFNVRPKDFEGIDGLNLVYTGKYAMYR